eukprot:s1003_g3.t1
MRTFLRVRASQGRTSAIIFADVSSAYYCAMRELASRLASSDTQPRDVNGALDALCLEYQLREPPTLAQQGAHPWLQALTETLNRGTWMHLKGDSVPIATRRGTRPGSAWADLTFGVLVGRILRLRDTCRGPNKVKGEVPQVPWDSRRDWGPPDGSDATLPLDDLIWADDLATRLDVLHVADTAKIVSAEAGALTDAFEAHGFQLSYGVKKTAALVCPKGPGARSVCRELFSGQPALTILCEQRGPVQLPLVNCYKHLGVMQARDGSIKQEIKARCAAAWTTFREGRTRLFRCRRITTRRRGVLLQTLVMSKLLFGCGAWPPLGVGDRQRFSGAVFSLYRATLGLQAADSQHLTLATICSLLGLLDYASLLRVEQLQYLRQLCAAAPDALWALLRQDPPYLQLLREALHWLFSRVRATCHLADPEVALEAWRVLICDRPSLFRGLIRRAKGLELCRLTCFAAMQAVYAALKQASQGTDLPEVEAGASCVEACLICRRGFSSRAAWACHASKKHGYRIAASLLIGGQAQPICEGCGKLFANQGRLRRHLLHSVSCRAGWGTFQLDPTPVPPRPGEAAPPLQLRGTCVSQAHAMDPASYSKGLLECLDSIDSPCAESVWAVVVDFVEPLATLRETLRIWAQSHCFEEPFASAAEDAQLMLDPVLCCDTFSPTKPNAPVAEACSDLPGPLDTTLPFVLTGASADFFLDKPPCPAFSYPYIGGAPLAAASRQTAYIEAMCDQIGAAIQQTAVSRVSADLRAPTSPVKASQATSPMSLSSEASAKTPSLQVPKAKARGRVAANFGAFMAAATPGTSAPNTAAAKVVMGGSVRQQARTDPLVANNPRVVAAGPADAASEKAEMAERLRKRGQSGETSNAHVEMHPRSSSFDSDDESLAKLSMALRSLEKNTAAREKRQLQEVASEAAHQLPERLEAP